MLLSDYTADNGTWWIIYNGISSDNVDINPNEIPNLNNQDWKD